MQSVAIRTEPELQAGTPTVLFDRPTLHDYDVMPDGSRFLVIERDVTSYPAEVHVVVNGFDELNRLAPAN